MTNDQGPIKRIMKSFKQILAAGLLALSAWTSPAQTYTITTSGWLHYGPFLCLTNPVNVPTNFIAGFQVGTNLQAAGVTPIVAIPAGVDLGVWADYTGTVLTTSNLYLNFGTTYGWDSNSPLAGTFGYPVVTNGWPNQTGTNTSLISSNQTLAVPLRFGSNNVYYGVIPKAALVGARGIQLVSASTDATNAAGVTLNKVRMAFDGPPGAEPPGYQNAR
jgi:hypothetical protein